MATTHVCPGSRNDKKRRKKSTATGFNFYGLMPELRTRRKTFIWRTLWRRNTFRIQKELLSIPRPGLLIPEVALQWYPRGFFTCKFSREGLWVKVSYIILWATLALWLATSILHTLQWRKTWPHLLRVLGYVKDSEQTSFYLQSPKLLKGAISRRTRKEWGDQTKAAAEDPKTAHTTKLSPPTKDSKNKCLNGFGYKSMKQ